MSTQPLAGEDTAARFDPIGATCASDPQREPADGVQIPPSTRSSTVCRRSRRSRASASGSARGALCVTSTATRPAGSSSPATVFATRTSRASAPALGAVALSSRRSSATRRASRSTSENGSWSLGHSYVASSRIKLELICIGPQPRLRRCAGHPEKVDSPRSSTKIC